jgi:hypothetical protein
MKTKKYYLKHSVAKILRPLVRIMLRNGMTFREFCDMAKTVFFHVGLDELAESSKRVTDSQLSIFTGLHRKDINEFRNLPAEEPPIIERETYSAGAAIIAEWTTNKLYADKDGQPAPLPYVSDKAHTPNFSSLVEGISKDIRPRAYLDELIRLKIVTVDENDIITLQQEAYLTSEDWAAQIDFLTRNVGDHANASVTNILASKPPFFDRSAYHGNLTEDDMTLLRTMIDTGAMELLRTVYRHAEKLALKNKNLAKKDALRMTLGIYFYNTKEQNDHE